jgi:hypothetical protein
MRDSRRARRLRVGVGLLAGCAVLAGCVSGRPLALVPPDRVAQTSLVLDAHGRRVAALHGAPVTLTVAVDARGVGGLGVTLVPEVLGQAEPAARQLLDQTDLGAEVVSGCDADPARAAAEPGRVWRSGPAPGAQAPVGRRVRLWVNPPSCPPRPRPRPAGPARRSRPPPGGRPARGQVRRAGPGRPGEVWGLAA